MGTVTPDAAEEQLRIIRERHERKTIGANDRSISHDNSHAASTSGNGDNTEQGHVIQIERIRTAIANSGDDNRGQVDSSNGPGDYGFDGNDTNITDDDNGEPSLNNKPTGLGFEPSSQEQDELFTLPPLPETKRTKDGRAIPPRPKVVEDVASGINNLFSSTKPKPQVPIQTIQPERTKKVPAPVPVKPITSAEASEIEDDIRTVLYGIFSLADSARYAYLPSHPKAEDGNGLFTLTEEELEEGTKWVLRRTSKSVRVAKNVRFVANLYDTYAVPIAIMYPRIQKFAKEIREQGVTLSGK